MLVHKDRVVLRALDSKYLAKDGIGRLLYPECGTAGLYFALDLSFFRMGFDVPSGRGISVLLLCLIDGPAVHTRIAFDPRIRLLGLELYRHIKPHLSRSCFRCIRAKPKWKRTVDMDRASEEHVVHQETTGGLALQRGDDSEPVRNGQARRILSRALSHHPVAVRARKII
jgi:hypothetical protein